MSENHAVRNVTTRLSAKSGYCIAPSMLVSVVLFAAAGQAAVATDDDYVAPKTAPAAWLDRLRAEDRRPLEAWASYLPPNFTEGLTWVTPKMEDNRHASKPPEHWGEWYGKVIVIQSWSHTDETSLARLDEVAGAVNRFSPIDVEFVALHIPAGADTAKAFIDRQEEWPHLTLIDTKGDYCDLLGVYKTPVNIIIARNGAVRYAGLTVDGVHEAIDHLLDEYAHSLPSRGSRNLERAPTAGATGYPAHNSAPRATDLQGRPAPEFFVQSWANHQPDQIEGRVNVIKFWRTNCPHCITAIPATTAMAEKYRGKVNFIDITHESMDALEQGLSRRGKPLDTIGQHIAVDTSSRMRQAVSPQGVPNAMVIDQNWTVRWQGHPAQITEQLIDQVLAADRSGGVLAARWREEREGPADRAQARGRDRTAPVRGAAADGYPAHNPQPRARNLQGQPGPEFAVQTWVNGEPDQIEGRVNVVKFWRTGCPHCITAISKTGELAEKYKGRVNFIDITGENETALTQGLSRRNVAIDSVKQFVAIDPTRRLQTAVGSQGVPNAIVFDKNWVVRWQGHPAQITEQMLEQILAADEKAGDEPVVARAERPARPEREQTAARPAREQQALPPDSVKSAMQSGGYPPHNPEPRARNLQGQPGPKFAVQSWANNEPDQIEGRVNVVKFWRTGCPHCINAIPKTGELADKYAGRVNFIDITGENETALNQGLSRRNVSLASMKQYVGIDPAQKMQQAVGAQGVPNAVILDKNWIVRWQGHPAQITEPMLDQILAADEKAEDAPARPLTAPARAQSQPPAANVAKRRINFVEADYPVFTDPVRATNDLRGKPGPEFHVEQWYSPEPLRVGSRVTFIEFWRTSCPHCRRAIDKHNEWNAQFAGLVDFIAISNENETVFEQGLERFQLSERSFNHFVALDPSMTMQKAINPQGVPHAIVLDSDWIVRWQGNPHALTPEILEQIVVADAWHQRQKLSARN